MYKSKLLAVSIGVTSLLWLLSLAAFCASAFDEGINCFRNRQFRAASGFFEQAIKQQPSNPQAYFWLGRTLEQLKDREGAKTMYEACYQLNPFCQQGMQAKKALLDLADSTARTQHPIDSPEIVHHTVRTIQRQADDLKQIKINHGNAHAQYRMRLGAYEAARIGYEMQQEIEDINQQMRYYSRRNRGMPLYYDVTGIQELSNRAQINANYQVTDSRVQARRYQQEALYQAAELQNSANNLTSLLSETKKPGEPKLRALGTNLFVRNYGEFDRDDIAPEDPQMELKATARRLSDPPAEVRAASKKPSSSAK